MYSSQDDEATACAHWVMDGPHVSKEEWDHHFADLQTAIRWHQKTGLRPACLLQVGRLFSPPDAVRRKQLAEISSHPSYKIYLALVTSNPLLRGALTAIQWLQPRKPYLIEIFSDTDQALVWLEQQRQCTLPALRGLVLEATRPQPRP